MDLKSFSNSVLLEQMKLKVETEKRTTAEIIEFVKEVERRRLFIKLHLNSLFDFMTEYFGYTPGSAQRRIDAARLLRDLPEIKSDIESGRLNLMQVSALARAVREKEKTSSVSVEEKRQIVETIKSQDLLKTEATIAKMLDIPIKQKESKRMQQDGSVRREITFSKEQEELLEQVKSLMSHVNPNPSVTDIFEYLAKRFIKQKVGSGKSPQTVNSTGKDANKAITSNRDANRSTAKMAVDQKSEILNNKREAVNQKRATVNNRPEAVNQELATANQQHQTVNNKPSNIRYVSLRDRKQLFQRHDCCQWEQDGKICGSKFQLQSDHIQPIWAGGSSEPQNLQLLCGFHNRMKYKIESGMRL